MDTGQKNTMYSEPETAHNTGSLFRKPIVILAIIVLLGIMIAFLSFGMPKPPSQVPAETLIISSGSPEYSSLTMVADRKGFFEKYGLNVTMKHFPTGVAAVNDLLAGNADLAYAAEFVGVVSSFQSPELRIIATTAKSDVIALVIRNDRGIKTPADLKGKTIAVPKGTAAEFFLGRFLTLNGMDITDVTVRDLAPADLVQSVVSGETDAAIIWEPHVYMIEQQLGGDSLTWPAQGGQHFYWVTYTRADVIRDRHDAIRRYLRALDEAETFLSTHEPEAQAIVQERMNMTDDYMGSMWGKNHFVVSLEQGLIVVMEDEARWMVEQNMTGGRAPPSYLDMIDQEPMREIRPSAVTIIR